ncbi:MAG TPA: 5'-3' exonuclease H3TH domain-containing protein [Vicinamibacteria bacterium]|nr:5'-3' exonuclease H3TH domain-containing protein [Vicinamibacteria bacterium]
MKVHLVDATYELFRAHFGAPPALDAAGRPVGAVRGLLATLISLLREPQVTHVACAFDHVIESFRNELFAGYKTGDGVAPELLAQFHPAEEAAAALGLVVWPMVHYEADDALATAAARSAADPRVEQVVICSPDKDLAQCVSGARVVCRDRRRGLDRDEAAVVERFGVRPGSIPDWLALVGDTADGIPGIPGWGERSAGAVLRVYERLEAIPDQAHLWTVGVRGRERLAASLAQRREEAGLYRRLATLCREVPLTEELGDLEWRGPGPGFEPLCRALGAPELVERVPRRGR